MLMSKTMIKLEATMFYFHFYAPLGGKTCFTQGTRGVEGDALLSLLFAHLGLKPAGRFVWLFKAD